MVRCCPNYGEFLSVGSSDPIKAQCTGKQRTKNTVDWRFTVIQHYNQFRRVSKCPPSCHWHREMVYQDVPWY